MISIHGALGSLYYALLPMIPVNKSAKPKCDKHLPGAVDGASHIYTKFKHRRWGQGSIHGVCKKCPLAPQYSDVRIPGETG